MSKLAQTEGMNRSLQSELATERLIDVFLICLLSK